MENKLHCVKSVRARSYSGPHFPTFGLNTERYVEYLSIQSKCGKMRTRITPPTVTFYTVLTIYETSTKKICEEINSLKIFHENLGFAYLILLINELLHFFRSCFCFCISFQSEVISERQ